MTDPDRTERTHRITAADLEVLRAAIIEVTAADMPKFFAFFQIKKLADLPAARFDEAKRLLAQIGGEEAMTDPDRTERTHRNCHCDHRT